MEFFLGWLVCAIISGFIGSGKGRTGLGWTLGILLGPLGLLIIAILTPIVIAPRNSVRKCPFCAETILADAIVCKHCGKDVPAAGPAVLVFKSDGHWDCPKCGTDNFPGYWRCPECGFDRPEDAVSPV